MSESRTDILNWINTTLAMNVTKIEQLGTGAAYCQIMDSIYGDVPLQKVKFNANQEFQYMNNFKVLQGVFLKHQIANAIPVERLVKLKFQDNMELSQWLKKFWDQNYRQDYYDALGRRAAAEGGTQMPTQTSSAPPKKRNTPTCSKPQLIYVPASYLTRTTNSPKHGPSERTLPVDRPSSLEQSMESLSVAAPSDKHGLLSFPNGAAGTVNATTEDPTLVLKLKKAVAELKDSSVKMQEERDFYFGKLRHIEILLHRFEQSPHSDLDLNGFVLKIQEILYEPCSPD